jgi:hypothetical protein
MRINLIHLMEPMERAALCRVAYPNMLHIKFSLARDQLGPFGWITAAVRANVGTRNKICRFPL